MDADKVVKTLLEKIPNPEVRKFTEYVLSTLPADLWKIPAASSHHLEDERGEYGNLIHTARVFRICEVLADSSDMKPVDRSELLSAALLHDLMKRGPKGKIPYTHDDHPQWMADYVESMRPMYDGARYISLYIRFHMGRWGEPKMSTKIGPIDALHIADAMEAHLGGVLGEIGK